MSFLYKEGLKDIGSLIASPMHSKKYNDPHMSAYRRLSDSLSPKDRVTGLTDLCL